MCVVALLGCGDDDGDHFIAAGSVGSPAECEQAVSGALRGCIGAVSSALRNCYSDAGELCADDAAPVVAAMDAAGAAVRSGCRSDALAQQTGYGPLMSLDGLAVRTEEACRAEATSVAARTFGGPQGAAWAGANAAQRTCLLAAHAAGVGLVDDIAAAQADCIRAPATCSPALVADTVTDLRQAAVAEVVAACGSIQARIGIDAATYVARTAAQADCVTAAGHPASAPLELGCGPDPSDAPLPRGEYVQVVLDEAEWGTRCGDGSPYAFQIRLAPAGSPVENVIVAMQGGGVCIFEQDCRNIPPDLFEALTDRAPTDGIFSNDPAVSPFANWTKVFLPYCTQDVFIGGGRTSEFNAITVHRYGAVNTRQALRRARDIVWGELDRTTATGYHPRRVRAFFGGFSAGAFGTLYNYHWVLDDLPWPRTTAFPDAGLALDNGEQLGVAALGGLLLGEPPLGWGARAFTPPYCFRGECAVGPNVLTLSAPRLLRLPEQQFMILTNQNDQTQVGTTFFTATAPWVNALRSSYCATKDLPGVSYFMPAEARSIHVISPDTDLFVDLEVDGETMQDWFAGAIADPTAVVNRVEEGDLVRELQGVEAFPCAVAP